MKVGCLPPLARSHQPAAAQPAGPVLVPSTRQLTFYSQPSPNECMPAMQNYLLGNFAFDLLVFAGTGAANHLPNCTSAGVLSFATCV
jgi:hypothetical protein